MDRFRRDRVLLWSPRPGRATLAATAVLVAGGPHVGVYALAVVSTAAFRLFRPIHTALLPVLCKTPFELRSANVVRGVLNALSALLGPLAAALLLALSSPPLVFVTAATLARRGSAAAGARTRRPHADCRNRRGESRAKPWKAFGRSAATATPAS